MKRAFAICALLDSGACFGAVPYTVFLGNVIHAETLKASISCPDDAFCDWAWVRFKVKISQHLSGPTVGGVVVAAREQHARPNGSPHETSLFVVSPISDPALRRKLGAAYMLIEYIKPEFCSSKPLGDYGLGPEGYYNDWGHEDGCSFIEYGQHE
jgi:hypothetical protein